MRTAAVIMECNPFHEGHRYILEKARQVTGCDCLLVVLSPDFVQRGEPAFFPKEKRVLDCLENGADLVLELPVAWACGSAEYFAAGALAVLEKLPMVTDLVFGSESGDLPALRAAADVLSAEPPVYRDALRSGLDAGLSFPAAMEKGLSAAGAAPPQGANDILGVQYLRFLPERIRAHAVLRTAAKSASALRLQYAGEGIPHLALADFYPALHYCLLREQDYTPYWDVTADLDRRLRRALTDDAALETLLAGVLSKNMTSTRIRRCLLHILLGITDADAEAWRLAGRIGYLRVLGIAGSGSALLPEIVRSACVPVITRASALPVLPAPFDAMLSLDLFASRLYDGTARSKYAPLPGAFTHCRHLSEASKPLIRL